VRRANAPVAALRDSPPRDTNGVRDIIPPRFGVEYTRGGAIRLMHRPGFGYLRPKPLPRQAGRAGREAFIRQYGRLVRDAPPDGPARGAGSGDGAVHHGRGRADRRRDGPAAAGVRPSGQPGDPCLPGQRPPAPREGAEPFLERPGRRVRPRLPAPHLNPTGRLWGVMHRHVTRNRFHADLRQFTGAVLRFLDGTLPREREAIAESVTDSFRMITHDGYRMVAWPPARPRPCGRGRISP